MAEAKLQFLLDLEDRVSPGIAKVQTSLDNFTGKVEKMKPTFTKMAAVGTAGFAAITGAVGLSIKAFAESEAQLARVDSILDTLSADTLKQFSGGVEQAKQIAREFGSEIQALGGIGDETASEGFAKLLQITKDSTKAMDAATVAADLATFKQIDYSTAVDIVSKVVAGNTSVLTRYGIVLKEGATAEEAMAELAARTAGQYEAYGKTVAGQTEIMKQTFGDLQENIGAAFVPALQSIMDTVKPLIDAFVKWAGDNPELLRTIVIVTGGLFGLLAVVGFLGLAIPALSAGFAGLAVVIGFLVSPIGLVIIAIGLLVAAAWYLWENWDKVIALVSAAWQGLKDTWGAVIDWMSDKILAFANWVNDKVQAIISAVKSAVSYVSNLPGIKQTLQVGSAIGNGISNAVGFITGRATGGPVASGTPYVVGEKGPELFVPGVSGMILPHAQLATAGIGGGYGPTYNITITGNTLLDRDSARKMGGELVKYLKDNMRL